MKNKKALSICLLTTAIILLTQPQTASAASGDLQIINLAGISQTFNSTYIQSLPQTTVTADISCYGVFVTGGNWVGVKLSDLLAAAGIDTASTGSIEFLANDGYHIVLDLQTAMRPDVIVAYQKDGTPLAEGYRLVIPGANGNLWISQITGIGASDMITDSSQTIYQAIPPIAQTQGKATAIQASQTPAPTAIPTSTPAPSNSSITHPVAPPTVTSEPTTNQSAPKENAIFPVETFYAGAAAVAAALVLASVFVVRRRKSEA